MVMFQYLAMFVTTLSAFLMPMATQAQSSVQLINLLGDPVSATCVADNANRSASVISSMGTERWEFNGEVLSVGWKCHFEWEDSSDCAGGPPCRKRTQDVKVWQSVIKGNRKFGGAIAALTPCVSCVWQIKFDGFYRAEKRDLVYTFIAGWN